MTDDTRWQTAVVSEIRELTPHIKSVVFDLPRAVPFVAGQHADVRLTAEDGYIAMRSYSIASAPEFPQRIELAIERLENGEVSPFFHDVVAVGDEIDVRSPLGGHFIWKSSDGGPLLLVGAGSGVVPLMAMIRHRQATAPRVPVVLVATSRTWAELPFGNELLVMHREHCGFALVVALTREQTSFDDVAVFHHRIDATVMRTALDTLPVPPRHVFVCGSNEFVDVATDAAVSNGVIGTVIRTERYGT